MTPKEFESWCNKLNLTKEVREEIAKIRNSEPARSTNSGPHNVSGIFNRSWKMGHSVQSESRTVELPAILMYEDPSNDVLEYWDQPPTFTVRFIDGKGRSRGHKCTPDFFVIRHDSAGWEEWKTEDALVKRAHDYPERYNKDGDGHWHYIPGEEYAKRYGLYFHVRSSSEINYILTRNSDILHGYYRPGYVSIVEDVTFDLISAFLSKRPQTTLSALLELAQTERFSSGCIYELIATKRIYVNVTRELLTDPDRTHVYLTEEDAVFYETIACGGDEAVAPVRIGEVLPGTKILFDGKPVTIVLVGSTLISLDDGGGSTVEVSISKFESYVERGLVTGIEAHPRQSLSDEAREYEAGFNRNDRIIALERYEIIRPRLEGEIISNPPVSMRTVRGWVKRYKEAKLKYGNGLLGLLPLHNRKGSTEPKLSGEIRALMIECIEQTYETVAERNKSVSYGEFRRRCKGNGVPDNQIPVYSTYWNEIRGRRGQEQEEKRRGSKAAYKYEQFYWVLDEKTPRHGERPWQVCHIDHTPIELLLVDPKTFKLLGIPTLTLLIDAFTRMILAYYLSFDRESRKSLMMVLRDCARRHNRFPELVVVDKGPPFFSVYFDSVIVNYNCDKRIRPTAKPRFGSPIERIFNTTQTQFIHNLMGNTKSWKNRRTITKEVNPKNLAVWSYGLLHPHFEGYVQKYNNREHPALEGQSPLQAFNIGMQQYDLPYVRITYDRNFLIETMPETTRGKGKIVQSRGIKFNYVFYNSPKFQRAKLIGTTVNTRYDPYDPSKIWAYVDGRWEEGYAPPSVYNMLKKCSEKDIAQMSEVLRQRRRVHASGYALRAEDIAEHLANATEDEERAIQRKLNLEAFTKNSPGGILTPASSDVEMQPAATGKLEEEYDQNQPLIYQRIRRHS